MLKPDLPYNTSVELLAPTYSYVKGVAVKSYETVDVINCKVKTYGGTERVSNDTLVIEDTANIETWYRPDITASTQFKLGEKVYEVIGTPEDVEQRHQILKFKVRAVRGGA